MAMTTSSCRRHCAPCGTPKLRSAPALQCASACSGCRPRPARTRRGWSPGWAPGDSGRARRCAASGAAGSGAAPRRVFLAPARGQRARLCSWPSRSGCSSSPPGRQHRSSQGRRRRDLRRKARAGQHAQQLRAKPRPRAALEPTFRSRRSTRASRMRSQDAPPPAPPGRPAKLAVDPWPAASFHRTRWTDRRCHPQHLLDGGLAAGSTRCAPLMRRDCMPSPIATSRRRAVLMRVMISSCTAGELTSTS
jgi:hypothetical protein